MRITNILLGIISTLLFLNLVSVNKMTLFPNAFAAEQKAQPKVIDVRIVGAQMTGALPVMIGYGNNLVVPIDNSGTRFGTNGRLSLPVRHQNP